MKRRMRIKIIDEVQYCCKKMRDYYESHNVKFDTKDEVPMYFYKMVYKGKMIDHCPFCGTYIETQIDKTHWGGEK